MTKILIINNAEPGISEFCESIEKILKSSGRAFNTIEYRHTLVTNINHYHGIILSGSPRGDDIVDHHLPYFEWIKTCRKPVFGICAGHHIIGTLFGAQLLRSVEKEVGDYLVFVDQQDPIFKGLGNKFLVRQNHHDSITLAQDFILLAHSEVCKVEVSKHAGRPIYSSQFHPEILNPEMILNFADIVDSLL